MGFKRPFDDEKFHELPLKHSRLLDYNDKSIQFEEFVPGDAVSQKCVATVNKGELCKLQGGESFDGETFDSETFDGETFDEESNFVLPGLDMDGAFECATKSCVGSNATSVKYFELGIPPRVFSPVETSYSFLLDQPVRKQVPIGPGHQAIIPEWEGSQNENLKQPSGMSVHNHIIPMPALNTPANMDNIVGKGRKFCVCHDRGSIRCVRQHIKEAREEMIKKLGFEKFRDLGFCDMGEEVAQNWSDEEALLFHEIVYSNPVTLGRNFWQHLEAAFCFRTKKEIVSYYFNVFVLRRRATQNRTFILDIDSDDDEWHGGYEGPLGTHYAIEDEEEDFAVQSAIHLGTEKINEKVYPLHQEEGASNSVNDEEGNIYTREGGTGLCDEHKMNATVEYMDRFSGSSEERLNMEDDTCTIFELANDSVNSGWSSCPKKDETGLGEHKRKSKECNDSMYPKISTNGKDLQPTGSIMEEIFGHGSWENKARNK